MVGRLRCRLQYLWKLNIRQRTAKESKARVLTPVIALKVTKMLSQDNIQPLDSLRRQRNLRDLAQESPAVLPRLLKEILPNSNVLLSSSYFLLLFLLLFHFQKLYQDVVEFCGLLNIFFMKPKHQDMLPSTFFLCLLNTPTRRLHHYGS